MYEEDIEKSTCYSFWIYQSRHRWYLTSNRVYKRAFSHEKAMQMILDGECGQFNPVLLQCLVNIQDRIKAGLD